MRILTIMSIIFINFLCIAFANLGNIYANENGFAKLFTLFKQEKWQECNKIAVAMNNDALLKMIQTQMMVSGIYNTDDGFIQITDFIKQNPHWPIQDDLKIAAEKAINKSTPNKNIIEWFKINPPITANGKKYHALAALSTIKDKTVLTPIVKNGWIYGTFTKDQQKQYLKKASVYLSHQDHINKIDLHITEGSIAQAKQIYPLVKSTYHKAFDLQIALMQNKNTTQNIKKFKNLSQDLRTPGLIYQYLKIKKADSLPSAKEIVALSKNAAKQNPGFADHFWKLQSYYAREYIERKRFKDAYAIASNHFTDLNKSRLNYYEAEFLSGWLANSFLKKHNLALEHFKNLGNAAKTPISKARGLYWMARSYQNIGNIDKANSLYKQAANNYGFTFYGQASAIALNMHSINIPSNVLIESKSNIVGNNKEILDAVKIASRYGPYFLSLKYIRSAIDKAPSNDHILSIVKIINDGHNLHYKTVTAKHAVQNNVFIKDMAYPTPYKTSHLPIEEALTYAIIRQESVFDQNAISHAGAKGLMQLINDSACATAKNLGLGCTISKLTKDTHYNMILGSSYLKEMIDRYNGSYILAIASYNAGPHRADRWINLYGDPRKMKNIHEIIDWIELIPYYETRNYVQRVLEALQIYRTILNKSDRLYLKDDLLNRNHKIVKKKGVTKYKHDITNKRQSA